MKHLFSRATLFSLLFTSFPAMAADLGYAKPWQLGFQAPATPVMEKLDSMHDFLLVLITVISVFVLLVLLYICARFNKKRHPVASKTAHNTKLEIIWTVIPIFILIAIAIPSLRLHYYMQHVENPEMTLKVTGYQWYWHYDYPDNGGFGFDSVLVKDKDLKPDEHRLLAVDNHVVIPVDTTVHVEMTGADVIHAWAVPAFGVKRDAVPGRLNETWFKAEKTGRFYGQCSELCGVGHGFMPIVIDVVSKDDFADWVKTKHKEAGLPDNAAPKANKDLPITEPISSEHENPKPIIEKEKAMTNEGASAKGKGDESHIGNGNQPVPSKAAGDKDKSKEKK
jgi:cytochrome c oxidase subunit 2